MRLRRAESRELLYIPVTERDEKVRRDIWYRVGRWLDSGGRAGLTAALLGVVGALVLLWQWIDPSAGGVTHGQEALLVTLGVAGLLGLYAWWFFERQERSELRRAYRFRAVDPEDDQEIGGAKQVLLSKESTLEEREQAVQLLLSRGACSLNKVSAKRELLGYVVGFAVIALVFLVLAWLA